MDHGTVEYVRYLEVILAISVSRCVIAGMVEEYPLLESPCLLLLGDR